MEACGAALQERGARGVHARMLEARREPAAARHGRTSRSTSEAHSATATDCLWCVHAAMRERERTRELQGHHRGPGPGHASSAKSHSCISLADAFASRFVAARN